MSSHAVLSKADMPAEDLVREIAQAAHDASYQMGLADSATRDAALTAAATVIRDSAAAIKAENEKDMAFAAEKGLNAAMQDRLLLNDERIEGMAAGLEQVAGLPDPLHRNLGEWTRPNGLMISRVSVPLGVDVFGGQGWEAYDRGEKTPPVPNERG